MRQKYVRLSSSKLANEDSTVCNYCSVTTDTDDSALIFPFNISVDYINTAYDVNSLESSTGTVGHAGCKR